LLPTGDSPVEPHSFRSAQLEYFI